jgi:phenylalanyl-tRNA synthetase beta chain
LEKVMAIVKIPKSKISKIMKITEDLAEKISLMGIPVESVTDNEVEIEVLPNRPDVLSVQGFLRALRAYYGKEQGLRIYNTKKPQSNYVVKIDKSLKNIRPYTVCAIVKNLKFDDENIKEIIDVQEKLHTTIGRNRKKIAIGIYPLDKISLPINFEARKPEDIKFIPLETDREMSGREILQRHPTGREYAHLLEGKDKFPVFVDSKGKILSMPPIINSHETGKITESTKEVFIECSGFDLSTLKKTLNIIVTTFADMGGTIYQMELQYPEKIISPDLSPEKMKLEISDVNNLLGLDLKEKEIERLLPKMGYNYKNKMVYIPAWRADILHQVDIIEDIAIAYGYNNFVPKIPKVSTVGEESKISKTQTKISEILIGLELIEVSSYHLITEDEAKKAKMSDKIEVENSKTEYKILRSDLSIPALRILSENKDNEYPQKIFEVGTVFAKDTLGKAETGIVESQHLLLASTPANFTEIKQILDYLFRMLSINYEIKEHTQEGFIEGRTGEILLNGKSIGHLGELHPETLRKWNIKMPLALAEISLECIFNEIGQ